MPFGRDTLVVPTNTIRQGFRGDLGVGTPSSLRCRLSPNYFGCCFLYLLLVGNRHEVNEGRVDPRYSKPLWVALRSTAMILHLNRIYLLLHVAIRSIHAHWFFHADQKRLQTTANAFSLLWTNQRRQNKTSQPSETTPLPSLLTMSEIGIRLSNKKATKWAGGSKMQYIIIYYERTR